MWSHHPHLVLLGPFQQRISERACDTELGGKWFGHFLTGRMLRLCGKSAHAHVSHKSHTSSLKSLCDKVKFNCASSASHREKTYPLCSFPHLKVPDWWHQTSNHEHFFAESCLHVWAGHCVALAATPNQVCLKRAFLAAYGPESIQDSNKAERQQKR